MKRILCIALGLILCCCYALSETLPETLTMKAGESLSFTLPFSGSWESDAPDVATAEGSTITAHTEGWAQLTLMNADEEFLVEVEVTDPVPDVIREAIRIAIEEWEAVGEKRLDKTKRGNKYIKWWGYENIGWCGAFANYCMDQAGVPLEPTDTFRKVKPHEGGIPYSVREAGVPKIRTAFENMERLTDIPRPGYLIIFGAKGYYDNVHVGIISHVEDMGDKVYRIETVEGNIGGGTVKRYCFLYDAKAAGTNNNMSYLPESQWTDEDTFDYEGPRQTKNNGKKHNWYVSTICQTWQ